MVRCVGSPVKRLEDPRLLRGEGRFTDDLTLPGTVHGVFVRSPVPHARITGFDAAAALALPGVLAVLTGTDPDVAGLRMPCAAAARSPERPILAEGTVRYEGEPVALVIATDRYLARDAADLVEVDYAELPVVMDIADPAAAPDLHAGFPGNIADTITVRAGDPDAAFAAAHLVVARRLRIQRVSHSAIETRGALARWDAGDELLTVWASCNGPFVFRTWVARLMGIPEASLRVIEPEVGGAFGSKLFGHTEEVAVCIAARRLGRPVKWIATRAESMAATVHARAQLHEIELAMAADGRILGLRDRAFGDVGGYFHFLGPAVPPFTAACLTSTYDIPNVDITLSTVLTNRVPIEAFRGAGRAESTYVIERIVDEAAAELGLDPVDVRMRNVIPTDRFPYANPGGLTYDAGRYGDAITAVCDALDYDTARVRQRAARDEGRCLGIGIAPYVMIGGFAPSTPQYNAYEGLPLHDAAFARMDPEGRMLLTVGASPSGQGNVTALAQVAADVLSVPLAHVRVQYGDTAFAPYSTGTHGSRAAVLGAHAVHRACGRVVEKARAVAAYMLEADVADVVVDEGRFHVAGSPDASLTWAQVAGEAHWMKVLPGDEFEAGLEATASWEPPDCTYAYGANGAVVEVDPETGSVRVLDFFSVDDCGTRINPMLVEGQIHGGIAQGLGQALSEEVVYGADGGLLSGSFASYTMPVAADIPPLRLHAFVTPTAGTALGTKGVGEAGAMASTPAIANAVADAIRHLGARLPDTPLTPHAVWCAIRAAGAEQSEANFEAIPGGA